MIQPGEKFPSVSLKNVAGGEWNLPQDCRAAFTLLVVYRGVHCSVCARYLSEIAEHLEALEAMNVEVITTSGDTREKGLQAQAEWSGGKLATGYGLDEATAKLLGLYLSSARKPVEPERFFEPGLYLITADGTLLFVSLQNMPFGRTPIQDLLDWIPKVLENNIPPRGTMRY